MSYLDDEEVKIIIDKMLKIQGTYTRSYQIIKDMMKVIDKKLDDVKLFRNRTDEMINSMLVRIQSLEDKLQ